MAENPVDAVPDHQAGEEACQVTEFPSVEEYCRQLEKQGIEYRIIPMQKRKVTDKKH